MLGSIIGDIAGSFYEVEEILAIKTNSEKKRNYEDRIKILDRNIPLFNDNDSYTDDSILTTAIADALINNKCYENYLKKYGKREINLGLDKYGRSRFGKGFVSWLNNSSEGNSYGNGSAMRVSAAGWLADTLEDVRRLARISAEVTHNHPEGIKGAEATASAIFMARKNFSKEQIKDYIINEFNYDLSRTCDEIRPDYYHVESCQQTVPEAIIAFLEGNDFEDVIRTAVSLGGDCDTLTAIAGSIAEAYYGVPDYLKKECYQRLDDSLSEVLEKFEQLIKDKSVL